VACLFKVALFEVGTFEVVLFAELFVFAEFLVPVSLVAAFLAAPRSPPPRAVAAGVFSRSPAEFFAERFVAFFVPALAAVLFFLPVSIETGFRSLIGF
jgi:hypothetical protein